jgi:flagellin
VNSSRASTTLAGEAGTGALSAGSVFTRPRHPRLGDGFGSPRRRFGGIDRQGRPRQAGRHRRRDRGGLSILSASGAKVAIQAIDKAIDKVSASRGDLVRYRTASKPASTCSTSTSTNVTEARSRIEDTDFSAETTQLAKAQILTQAATPRCWLRPTRASRACSASSGKG